MDLKPLVMAAAACIFPAAGLGGAQDAKPVPAIVQQAEQKVPTEANDSTPDIVQDIASMLRSGHSLVDTHFSLDTDFCPGGNLKTPGRTYFGWIPARGSDGREARFPGGKFVAEFRYGDVGSNGPTWQDTLESVFPIGGGKHIKFVDRGLDGPTPPDEVYMIGGKGSIGETEKGIGGYKHPSWNLYRGLMLDARSALRQRGTR